MIIDSKEIPPQKRKRIRTDNSEEVEKTAYTLFLDIQSRNSLLKGPLLYKETRFFM
jgi:hypothetical protein